MATATRSIFLKIGRVLSVIFHPCFVFFYCFCLIHFYLRQGMNPTYFWEVFFIILGTTVVLPAIFPIIFAGDAFLMDRRKRPAVLLFTIICYTGCFAWLFWYLQNPSTYVGSNSAAFFELYIALSLLTCLVIGLIMVFIISFWFKISLHGNGVGFLLAICILVQIQLRLLPTDILLVGTTINLILLLLCILLLWQRVASGSHTQLQLFTGLFGGLIITFVILVIIFPSLLSPGGFDFAYSVIPGWHTPILPGWFR